MQLMTLLNCCYPRPVNVTLLHALPAQTEDSDSENGVFTEKSHSTVCRVRVSATILPVLQIHWLLVLTSG